MDRSKIKQLISAIFICALLLSCGFDSTGQTTNDNKCLLTAEQGTSGDTDLPSSGSATEQQLVNAVNQAPQNSSLRQKQRRALAAFYLSNHEFDRAEKLMLESVEDADHAMDRDSRYGALNDLLEFYFAARKFTQANETLQKIDQLLWNAPVKFQSRIEGYKAIRSSDEFQLKYIYHTRTPTAVPFARIGQFGNLLFVGLPFFSRGSIALLLIAKLILGLSVTCCLYRMLSARLCYSVVAAMAASVLSCFLVQLISPPAYDLSASLQINHRYDDILLFEFEWLVFVQTTLFVVLPSLIESSIVCSLGGVPANYRLRLLLCLAHVIACVLLRYCGGSLIGSH
jgi:hypothetical protein